MTSPPLLPRGDPASGTMVKYQTLTDFEDVYQEVLLVTFLVLVGQVGVQQYPKDKMYTKFFESGKGFLSKGIWFEQLVCHVNAAHQTIIFFNVEWLVIKNSFIPEVCFALLYHASCIQTCQYTDLFLSIYLTSVLPFLAKVDSCLESFSSISFLGGPLPACTTPVSDVSLVSK